VSVDLLLIRRRRPIGEPDGLRPLGETGVATLDGTSGAGRIVLALSGAGIRCDPITQLVVPPDLSLEGLRTLDLGTRHPVVVLGSHLVNLPEETRRAAFLGLAARHATMDGTVVVEHHPIDWAETAADVEPTPGSSVGMEEVRRDPPFVSAVSVFDMGGRVERRPFIARVLSERELAEALAGVGLRVTQRLGPTWIEAHKGLTPGA
jgi:hypothetical protein